MKRSRLFIFAFVLGLLILFGCTNPSPKSEKPPPPISVSEPQSDPDPPPPPSRQPTSTPKLTSAPAAGPSASPKSPPESAQKFIDKVYVLDLETNSKPMGRALVAGKTYEVIAESKTPFSGYVRFTVVIDKEELDSREATCPEFCANENMYSLPLTIDEGDYHEIQILAEDGSGAKSESVVYTYAASAETAGYLAETCVLDTTVGEYPPDSASIETSVTGATITEGWPANTTVNTYNGHGNLANLCDNLTASSPVDGGFLAQTWCAMSYTASFDRAPKPDKVACTCECTASLHDLDLTTNVRVDFPRWADYDGAPQCEKNEWDRFIQATKTHEEGHVQQCRDASPKVEEHLLNTPTQTAEAASCAAACTTAVDKLKTDLRGRLNDGYDQFFTQPAAAYDAANNHGETQGAVLHCDAC